MSNHERSAGYTTPATITGQIAGIFAMSNLCARKPQVSLRDELSELLKAQSNQTADTLVNS